MATKALKRGEALISLLSIKSLNPHKVRHLIGRSVSLALVSLHSWAE